MTLSNTRSLLSERAPTASSLSFRALASILHRSRIAYPLDSNYSTMERAENLGLQSLDTAACRGEKPIPAAPSKSHAARPYPHEPAP